MPELAILHITNVSVGLSCIGHYLSSTLKHDDVTQVRAYIIIAGI